MTSTNSRYLALASGHIDSLIAYVHDIKPYHTKLSEVAEEYIFGDDINIKLTEAEHLLAFLGADLLPSTLTTPGVRLRRSQTWYRDITSDGTKRIWEVPLTSVHKFVSHASQETFIADGVQDLGTIPGLSTGVFNPRRWDGPGITNVQLNTVHQQESFDYYLSHGAYSFETRVGGRWKELNLKNIPAFAENPGDLLYQDVIKSYGVITNITLGNYEEWTLTCISVSPAILEVRGSISGIIGTATINVPFVNALLSFSFIEGPSELTETIAVDDAFVLTSFRKITVDPTAPIEQWSLIKTNPIALDGKPTFVSPSHPLRLDNPALEIHTRSLDVETEASTWNVTFNSDGTYNLQVTRVSDGGYTISNIDLRDGCSFKNDDIHFTIIPTAVGFYAGDVFNWTVGERVENYLVYGSVSGWQPNAKIGEWYWNGKIGFKIPKLEYWAKAYNSTIVSSTDANVGSWNTVISNNQILRSVSYDASNASFFTAGNRSIVGGSADGLTWTSDLSTLVTPTPNRFLVVVGPNGQIGTSSDGIVWLAQDSHTTKNLKATTQIPNFLTPLPYPPAVPDSLNCIIIVGEGGTILTSVTGTGWADQVSGTNQDLNDITWSNDAIIAVGNTGTILRSLDRITWTQIPSFTSADLHSIIYEPGLNAFIAVGESGTILRSTDGGLTWFNLGAFSSGTFNSVAYGNGQFVAVGQDGWVASSTDGGIVWTRYPGPRLNSIAFGDGRFIGVGGKESEMEQFVALDPVHSMAEPSVYTVTFINSTNATVQNNIYGFRRGLVVGERWEDEFTAFKLDPLPAGHAYIRGDTVKIFLAPNYTYAAEGWYDELPYEFPHYDTGVADITVPWLYNEEYFPLYHGHGSVIFQTITAGDNVVIDKALLDAMRLKIVGSTAIYPDLAPEADWIPLEFRYFDRLTSGIPSSTAEFSDLTTYVEAYLCSDPSVKVLTIAQPRYETSNRNASALLTIDPDFFNNYIPFNTKYSLWFKPDESYGQTLRVKITENLRTYARVYLDFTEIHFISVSDAIPQAMEIVGDISLIDAFNVSFVEGGALPLPNGYDIYPFDIFAYEQRIYNGVLSGLVETSPGVYDWTGSPEDWIMPKPTVGAPGVSVSEEPSPEMAGASFVEGLVILENIGGNPDRVSMTYDVNRDTPAGGLLISITADTYLITHNGPAVTPVLIVESVANPGVYGNPLPNLNPYSPIPSILSTGSFTFTLPLGFTVPFKLTLT